MSLDTREKRAVLMGLLPLPDGTIGIADRYQIIELPYLAAVIVPDIAGDVAGAVTMLHDASGRVSVLHDAAGSVLLLHDAVGRVRLN